MELQDTCSMEVCTEHWSSCQRHGSPVDMWSSGSFGHETSTRYIGYQPGHEYSWYRSGVKQLLLEQWLITFRINRKVPIMYQSIYWQGDALSVSFTESSLASGLSDSSHFGQALSLDQGFRLNYPYYEETQG